MSIRLLDSVTINRIAAGEVIERPAFAVKELIENALDAGSSHIQVHLREGGKSLIVIQDNGKGMCPEDLALCVERHATSKLPENDLMDIKTMGFRGEALPSIGAVSRLHISSFDKITGSSWKQIVEGGDKLPLEPASLPEGTRVEVRDLFFATPARLKFLKTDKTELSHIISLIEKIALIRHSVGFTLRDEQKIIFDYPAEKNWFERISAVLGTTVTNNMTEVCFQKEYVDVRGFVGVPTLNKSTGQNQYIYVNDRPVQDKLLLNAIRSAYSDLLARDRFPVVVLNVIVPSEFLDVNVHPAKTEVRFQDSQLVRNAIVYAVREQLTAVSNVTSTTIHDAAKEALTLFSSSEQKTFEALDRPSLSNVLSSYSTPHSSASRSSAFTPTTKNIVSAWDNLPSQETSTSSLSYFESATKTEPMISNIALPEPLIQMEKYPLGQAVAQLFDTYILSQTDDGLIIVDQHAAHERLTYERMKEEKLHNGVQSDSLLIPLIVEFSVAEMEIIQPLLPGLTSLGFQVSTFGPKALQIKSVPTLLVQKDIQKLLKDIVEQFSDQDSKEVLKEHLYSICAEFACKNSIKAGRKLSIPEMNTLLRDMEQSSFSGQCNHGRPTYIKLHKSDIEKLLGRS